MALTRDFAEVEPDETPTFLSFKSAKVLIPLAFSTSTVTWSVKYGVVKSQLSFLSSVIVKVASTQSMSPESRSSVLVAAVTAVNSTSTPRYSAIFSAKLISSPEYSLVSGS